MADSDIYLPRQYTSQVAILALNILGEPLEDELLGESERLNFDEVRLWNFSPHWTPLFSSAG